MRESDDYSTDEKRNKRSRENDEVSFPKSRKTPRTPTKSEQKSEDKLDKILNIIKKVSAEVSLIREQQKELGEEFKKLKMENEEIRQENKVIKDENKAIKNELLDLRHKMERIDKDKRKNNVVINGLAIDTTHGEILKDTIGTFFENNLYVRIPIKETYKLGQKIYKVEFASKQEKIKIMQNKHKLKELRNEKIFN